MSGCHALSPFRSLTVAIVVVTGLGLGWAPVLRAQPEITLEQIMADPDWLGNPPEAPYWADDGRSLYFEQKRPGSELRDLVQITIAGEPLRTVAVQDLGGADAGGGELSPDVTRKVYARAGDLFVKDLASGAVRQLTRTAAVESEPRFLAGGTRIHFLRDGAFFVRDLENGLESQAADLRFTEDPSAKKPEEGYLATQEPRLFEFLQREKAAREAALERERLERREDPTRLPPPFFLGPEVEIRQQALSSSGRWLLLALGKKGENEGRKDMMPAWITDSGYVEPREVRAKVGTGEAVTERLVLLDLERGEQVELSLESLPGLGEDPLAELRQAAEARKRGPASADGIEQEDLPIPEDAPPSEPIDPDGGGWPQGATPPLDPETVPAPPAAAPKPEAQPKLRPVTFQLGWSPEGDRALVLAFSRDNKDRWIAWVDPEARRLRPLHRLSDPAWIAWDFNEAGFVPKRELAWYLSEETGFAQLFVRGFEEGSAPRALTSGQRVVSNVTPSRDGRFLYFVTNPSHPGEYEVHRVDIESGVEEPLTRLGGLVRFWLSPQEDKLLLLHSKALEPPELYVQALTPGTPAERVTRTVSSTFQAIAWTAPQHVAIPSNHAPLPIHARLYLPPELATRCEGATCTPPLPAAEVGEPAQRYPVVFFIHGAGYLQNAHKGWSTYFREFLFHSLLTRRGYIVVDLDFRASAGYGRDWRTAIYRRMGTPELEDLDDSVAWLASELPIDRARLGIYGGSYGGFVTLMAMFRRPDLFAAGAALRTVTDWAHYNHPYTSNILNTPDLDPEAYERSSPIELADGLARPLLICAPMQDDNVFFQDTVRLAQRLIELEKEDWEVAIYPVEPHSFRQPSSWLDEYRRIFKLFERHLKP
jgi:dipeptidyl aminopeptidase/acylaminoacyl peptidase